MAELITDALLDLDKKQTWLGIRVAEIEGRPDPYSQSAISQMLGRIESQTPSRIFAFEEALELAPGTLSRLLGYVPAAASPAATVPEAISTDPHLRRGDRELMLGMYNTLVERRGDRRPNDR